MRRLRFLVLAGLFPAFSCSSEELVVREHGVVAEVHLHQYDFGSHAAASFIDTRVPFRDELDEVIVHFVVPPVMVDGGCRLSVPSVCAPACNGETHYCSEGRCVTYEQLRFQDNGPVTITGSSHASPLTLLFNPKVRSYQPEPHPVLPLYRAGDRLTIETTGAFAFRAEVVAPARPNAITPLLLPNGPYTIAWEPGQGTIAIRLLASSPSGESAFISCVVEDRGTVTIPAAMMARVPPPPRAVQLEIERRERRVIPLPSGDLAVVSLASTLFRDRTD